MTLRLASLPKKFTNPIRFYNSKSGASPDVSERLGGRSAHTRLLATDKNVEEKKTFKTDDHYLPIQGPNGLIEASQSEFFKKVLMDSRGKGWLQINMAARFKAIQYYYLTAKPYSKEEAQQHSMEYGMSLKHLGRSIGITDSKALKIFSSSNNNDVNQLLDYYFPSGDMREKPQINNPDKYITTDVLIQSNREITGTSPEESKDYYAFKETRLFSTTSSINGALYLQLITNIYQNLDKLLEKMQRDAANSKKDEDKLIDTVMASNKLKEQVSEFGVLPQHSKLWKNIVPGKLSVGYYVKIKDEIIRLTSHPLISLEEKFLRQHFDRKSVAKDSEISIIKPVTQRRAESYTLLNGQVVENVIIIEAEGTKKYTFAKVRLIKLPQKVKDVGEIYFAVNGINYSRYFPQIMDRLQVLSPLALLDLHGWYHIEAEVDGGAYNQTNDYTPVSEPWLHEHRSGPAGAIRHAIATGLHQAGSPRDKAMLVNAALMLSDNRFNERAHPARKGARKNKRWSRR